jgi:hypothetical protein
LGERHDRVCALEQRGGIAISTERNNPAGARRSASASLRASGMTCTPQEREALVKIASGDTRIAQEQMRRLFMMRLVDRELGVVHLTREGRQLLGLPD